MKFLLGQPSSENAIAYCHNPQYLGYLSVKLIKCHKCLDKHCKYLHPYENNPFWVKRRRVKQEKKLREYIKKDNIEGIGELIAGIIAKGYAEDDLGGKYEQA